jgi:hypothetical protein
MAVAAELALNFAAGSLGSIPGVAHFHFLKGTVSMREITTHKVNGCNDALKIEATDAPGNGGANHLYEISGFDAATNDIGKQRYVFTTLPILFQNGPIKEVGTNGVTHEALLAIVVDRLESFQKGPFACEDNQLALDAIGMGIAHLKRRTIARLARGVEGTHEK